MATTLYGYGNIVTENGSYTLVPILGIAGGAGVTFTGSGVTDALLSFPTALISLANPYLVTSTNSANVTIDTTASLISALNGIQLTADGGTINVTGGNIVSALSGNTYFIKNDGTLNLGNLNGDPNAISALGGTKVTFQDGGGTLVVSPGGTNIQLIAFSSIAGFDVSRATIEIPGAGSVTNSTYDSVTNTTSITTDTGLTIQIDGEFTGSKGNLYQQVSGNNLYLSSTAYNSLSPDGSSGTAEVVPSCFLAGSMISTSRGNVAIEDIKVGDQVITFDWKNNKNIIRSVIWIGKAHYTVHPSLHEDEAGYPVRIKKDAFADNVPYKDMLVTSEHCLFMDNGFIPVRMLVNGRSIYYDRSITSYDYYHLELEEHSVITADGVLSESYLNTFNHKNFYDADNVITLRMGVKTWEKDAAAVLITSRDRVEPIYHKFEMRADFLGFVKQYVDNVVTYDPEFCLITEKGEVLYPHSHSDHKHYVFILPHDVKQVHLHSRSSRPSDAIGSFVDDRRELGVLVGNVTIFNRNTTYSVCSYLDENELSGWHALENGKCRWTNGNALLSVGTELSHDDSRILVVELLAAGPYLERRGNVTYYRNVV